MARPRAVDIFCGAGGMSLGVEQAGFDVVAAVDSDPIHCATHEFNFPDCAVTCADAHAVDFKAFKASIGHVDLVFGGPPCQGFSLMGKRDVKDGRNNLVSEFARAIVDIGPDYFIMENVAGIAIGAHRAYLDGFIKTVERAGYRLLPPTTLNAADFGVPQNRQRVFLLGWLGCNPAPRGAFAPASYETSVWEAIGDLPNVDLFPELLSSDSMPAQPPRAGWAGTRAVAGPDFSRARDWDRGTLTSSMASVHAPEVRKRFLETAPGAQEPVSRLFKLDARGLCNTLRAGTDSSKGSFTAPRPIHPVDGRCITVREGARLHSYPDWFRFHRTKWHGFRQVGNSVPPPLAKAVAGEVMRAIGSPEPGRSCFRKKDESLLRLTASEAARRYGCSGS